MHIFFCLQGKSDLISLVRAMCAKFSQQCPVYTRRISIPDPQTMQQLAFRHMGSSSLPRNLASPTIQAINKPTLPQGVQSPFVYPAFPPALPYDSQVALQLEITKLQKELADSQQNLQDVITQLEDERARSASTAEEVASLQQQLKLKEEQNQHVKQNLEMITSRLLQAREEIEREKAEKEEVRLTLNSRLSDLSLATDKMLQQ